MQKTRGPAIGDRDSEGNAATLPPEDVVLGTSPRMRALFDYLEVIAASDSTALIVGETGTGKDVVARLLHRRGPRQAGPFVAVSCASLPESLVEAELFGHERGAFTGATQARAGRFEVADGGTLFLDDVDDVPPGIQVKLLRVLQERTVERVGGVKPIAVNVRVMAGAKRDLRELVLAGRFRQDLFYRLNVLPIALPPLRARPEDIPLLTDHFLARFAHPRPALTVSPAVREMFQRYAWPGNVRELEHACERIAQTCTCGAVVRCGCVPPAILLNEPLTGAAAADAGWPVDMSSLDDRLHQVEHDLIARALRATRGNRSKAAALLRVKRSTLGDRIRRLGLAEQEAGPAEAQVGPAEAPAGRVPRGPGRRKPGDPAGAREE